MFIIMHIAAAYYYKKTLGVLALNKLLHSNHILKWQILI